jgi:ABC-type dipeptide/oligopeptide/nickel transport system ATPase subunit
MLMLLACGKPETDNRPASNAKTASENSFEVDTIRLAGGDLAIRAGEVVAVVGKSGSGKSTLAHILVQVLAPDAGEVLFFGSPMNDRKAAAVLSAMHLPTSPDFLCRTCHVLSGGQRRVGGR